jgi:hypothetical protein
MIRKNFPIGSCLPRDLNAKQQEWFSADSPAPAVALKKATTERVGLSEVVVRDQIATP